MVIFQILFLNCWLPGIWADRDEGPKTRLVEEPG